MFLFMMPSWSVPSELWMRRMLESVTDHLVAVACYEAPVPEYSGVPVINLGRRSDFATIDRGMDELRRVLGADPRAVVLCHYFPFAMRYQSVWDAVANPVYVHGHGYDLTWDLQRDGKRFHPPDYTQQVVRLAQRATLIANSRISADRIRAIGVPPERILVKYLGVPVDSYRSPGFSKASPEMAMLYLGRLIDFKGPIETIRAFALACAAGLRARLTIAGDGPLRQSVEQAAMASGVSDRISLLGEVTPEQGKALRASHHLFVAHSQLGPQSGQTEALGVAYLEAMSAGLPVVSADGGSLAEIVEDGRSGLLCRPGDLQGHADLLLRIASDVPLWSRLSHGAWEAVRDRFSLEQERNTLLELLPSSHSQEVSNCP